MHDEKRRNDPRWSRTEKLGRAGFAALLLAGLGLLVAGCGGGSKSPSVASLATTPSNDSIRARSSSGAFSLPSGAGIGSSISTSLGKGAAGVKFATCMRSNGVPNFPDPDSQGTITIIVSASLNPRSPGFRRALAACHHLIPSGSEAGHTLSQAEYQQMKARVLAFGACMRSHGVPNYSDPTFLNGGITQGYGAKGAVDPNSPIFQTAQRTCQGLRTKSP
jgi:hypothetical protein